MNAIRLGLISLVLGASARAQDPTSSCTGKLAGLRAKVQENYAGYLLEVTGARRAAYESNYRVLVAAADSARGDACYFVLDRFVRWFDDPHLFVFQSTRLDTAESSRRARHVRRTGLTEERVRRQLSDRSRRLDPIEGIWYDGSRLRVAILADSTAGRFSAVVLTSDTTAWPVGAVRASIARQGNEYAVDLDERNFARRQLRARIHKEVILRLSPGIWAKEFPTPPIAGLVDSRTPSRPTLVWRGSTAIVSLVSHDPAYRPVLDSLVAANDSALRGAGTLIVDLRGNEGGASFMSDGLLPFIRSRDRRTHRYPVGDTAYMLSSPDQIAYARRGGDTTAFARTLIDRLTSAPGQLVPMPPFRRDADTTSIGPSRVGVITDRGTVSASEVLVLKALQSTRARVFGEPTAGALDYQSAFIVPIAPDERRWYLGYPTITASRELPRGGMRGKGIAPDVAVPTASLWGTIDDVERRLSRQ